MELLDRPVSADAYSECRNPATGEILGYIRRHTWDDLKSAIDRARKAQPLWQALPVKERIRRLKPVRGYVMNHADEIAEIIAANNGKTRVDALATEVLPALMGHAYYSRHARRFLKTRRIRGGNIMLINKRSRLARIPYGVIGILSPWNYPFAIPFSEILMALLAGNSVVARPADETALVTKALDDCFRAADLPDGILTILNMRGPGFGEKMLEYGVDKLFFTGSVAVGKKLMEKAAGTLTPVVLELGGNDAMIVCADADLERAANGAVWAGLHNAGQSCGGVERIYVHESVHRPFLDILKEHVEALRIGPDRQYDVDIGSMTTERSLNTVKEHVREALDRGAKVFAQSAQIDAGLCHPAMVITDVDHSMKIMREETFGPVVGVMKYRTDHEAVELANDSKLGLTASVWSRDTKRALALAGRIKAGVVTINDHLMSHGLAETPWGGFKESGIGRTHGRLGFDEMTQAQTLVTDILPFVKKDLWWHPFDRKVYEGIRGVALALYGNFRERLAGVFAVLRIARRIFRS